MGIKIIAKNKKASHDYFLLEKIEAGIVLQGTEVKSLRTGKVSIAESYISITPENEIWINNMRIPHYEFGNLNNHNETRRRKLLLHSKEIIKLNHQLKTQGATIVPLAIYFKGPLVKLEMALTNGKKHFDKRHEEAKKSLNRKLKRGMYENI